MYDQLVETWLINNRVTLMLLNEISQEGLESSVSTRGGRTVGQQLAHVYWVRRNKIEEADKTIAAELPVIEREHGHDKELLIKGFELSGAAVADIILASADNDGKVKGFKRGITALVGYLIAHDSHHRGHIMLTLKLCKQSIPSNERMSLWAWNKI